MKNRITKSITGKDSGKIWKCINCGFYDSIKKYLYKKWKKAESYNALSLFCQEFTNVTIS